MERYSRNIVLLRMELVIFSMSHKYGSVMFCLNFFENFNVGTKKAVKRFKLSMHVIL